MKWLGWVTVRTLLVVFWLSTCLGQNIIHTANKRQVDPFYRQYVLLGGSGARDIDEEQNEPGFIEPDDDFQPDESVDKRVLSSFRERMEKQKELENDYAKWAEPFLRDFERDKEMSNSRYDDESNRNFERFLNELWEEYKTSTRNTGYGYEGPKVYRGFSDQYRKRREPDYPSLGWSGVGYRKRGGIPFDDDIPRGYQIRRRQLRRNYYDIPDDYLYVNKEKRNAVSKRSSNYYANHHKRSNKEQTDKKVKKEHEYEHASGTDPKIMKDLKSLFDVKEGNNNTNEVEIKKPTVVENKTDPEHLNIKKKSLDWSNYFGYDRRKKANSDIDEEWLMDRYRNVLSAAKRTTEYPLKYFKNHDDLNDSKKKKDDSSPDDKKPEPEKTNEAKLIEMDTKLKNIEDLIIDEALKYTGAHEGTTDAKQIQEIKDKVISRLAAAYSLEKMRKALGEFKNSIATQRSAIQSNDINEFDENEKKRGSDVADEKDKKFAEKKDNFHSGNELNFDDNQRPFFNNPISGVGDLETLERRCRSLALSVSDHHDFFYPLCKWHQACTACSAESYSKSLTNCDMLFLSKAYEFCGGEPMCQWSARPALEYLKDAAEEQPIDRFSICNQIDDPYKLIR